MPREDEVDGEQLWCPLFLTDGVARIALSGALDSVSMEVLEEALRRAVGHADLIVLDLADLTSVDAAGARLVRAVARRLEWTGGRLVLEAVPGHAEALLERLGADPGATSDSALG